MSLCERLQEYVSACFTGLWIQSHEHDDALREITQLCRVQHWRQMGRLMKFVSAHFVHRGRPHN